MVKKEIMTIRGDYFVDNDTDTKEDLVIYWDGKVFELSYKNGEHIYSSELLCELLLLLSGTIKI